MRLHGLDIWHVVELLSLFFTGLLAGLEMGVHYGVGAPPERIAQDAQILVRQAMVLRLRILAPALFLPALLFSIGAVLHHGVLWLNLIGIAALVLWIVLRAVQTVPVNSATLAWNPAAPPPDWREQLQRTERAHVVAAWSAALAFACFLSAFGRPLSR